MRKVKCYQCGRSYDFDQDDFCPRCGSFNAPEDSPSTKLERDLLSRFDTARQAPRYIPTSTGAAQNAGGRRHSSRIEDCQPCRDAGKQRSARKRGGSAKGKLNGLAVILFIVVVILLAEVLPWLLVRLQLLFRLY